VTQKYDPELFNLYVQNYSDKYLKVFEKNTEIIWKESKGNTFV
jgi:hypothetical protein